MGTSSEYSGFTQVDRGNIVVSINYRLGPLGWFHYYDEGMDMVKGITGKLIGDKGYISKKLSAELFEQKVTLITKIKKNMKNILMDTTDKMMLMRRSFIETIFSSMKSLNTLIHSRHRSPINAFSHLFAGLINYQIRTDKPSLDQLVKLDSYA